MTVRMLCTVLQAPTLVVKTANPTAVTEAPSPTPTLPEVCVVLLLCNSQCTSMWLCACCECLHCALMLVLSRKLTARRTHARS
jgi:hypothetical protein